MDGAFNDNIQKNIINTLKKFGILSENDKSDVEIYSYINEFTTNIKPL